MNGPVRLLVSGATGRMGRAIGRLAGESEDLRVIGGIARGATPERARQSGYPALRDVAGARELIDRADAIVDVSAPPQLGDLIDRHADALAEKALLIGTTGLDDALEARLDELSASAAVLVASNFSVGVNLLIGLVERAARALPGDRYDIEVVETHHRGKEDAPSGTALSLGRSAATARGVDLRDVRRDGRSGRPGRRPAGEIGFHALRGGDVSGEHAVHFLGDGERITMSHSATSRELFARGALLAVRWLAGREPGRYRMMDVLGL